MSKEAKKQVRKTMLAKRRELSPEEVKSKSAAIAQRVWQAGLLNGAKTVALYAAAPGAGEVSTLDLFSRLREKGARIALPRVRGKGPHLDFFEVSDFSRLETSSFGIPEPRGDEPPVTPEEFDAVIVPGVAFDAEGRRVGYGMGCYDRVLGKVRPGTPLLALAYDFQVIARAPVEAHDVPLTAVITETRTFLPRKGRDCI